MIERSISRAVVTGPTGAIGTALCLELAKQGIHVFAVCRPGSHRIGAIPVHKNITVVSCDAAELFRLNQLIPEGADAFGICHGNHIISAYWDLQCGSGGNP